MSMKSKPNSNNRLPDLIIIGAQKCATTSLHYYLNLHPQISMSLEKELNFFVEERNWNQGLDWYTSHFRGDAQLHGESSPSYTNVPFYTGIPARMHSVIPRVKLIYILRDPIQRIISHYIHLYSFELEHRPLTKALQDFETNPYVCRSQYYRQLEQYLPYFPKSQLLIITQEDLNRHRQQTLQKIFHFLDVDDSFYSRKFSSVQHKSIYKRRRNRIGQFLAQSPLMRAVDNLPFPMRGRTKVMLFYPFSHKITPPTMNSDLHLALVEHLREDITRLREFTGQDFPEWCI